MKFDPGPEPRAPGAETCEFDIAVVGAGAVGAALALALRGERIALAGTPPPPSLAEDRSLDSRIYALSPASAAFLESIGAWRAMPPERIARVRAMEISGDDGTSRLGFDAYEAGASELAWIVEDRVLQAAIWRALRETTVPVLGACAALSLGERAATLELRDGKRSPVRLVVGADGANSLVRASARFTVTERSYGQAALVANFECERSHADTARQWFQGNGKGGAILALLPLPGRRVSMVWSLPPEEAQRMEGLSEERLCDAVAAAAGGALGSLSLATPPRRFALRRLAARRLVGPRVALVGDAAHVVHPLAGQGLNLGLGDARELARTLLEREPGRDPGDARLLRRFERSRAEPNLAMAATIDGLFGLFGAGAAPIARVRNAGLNLAERIPVLKTALMRQAMR